MLRLVGSGRFGERSHALREQWYSCFAPSTEHWHTIAKHEIDNDAEHPNFWHSFSACYRWTPQVFDSLLRLVADDIVANTMILRATYEKAWTGWARGKHALQS